MEVAALGLKVEGVESIDRARDSLGRFVKASQDAEGAAEGVKGASGRARDEFGRFKKSTDDASKGASGLGREAEKASRSIFGFGRSGDSAAGSMNALASTAMKVGGVLVAAFSARAVIQYADAWSDMQSRVGAATGSMDTAGASMQRLLQIANASYSPLEQTAEIYSRNVSTFRDLGRSAAEAADFTESLNNMLVLTATRGERAASVQNALSKAMAVGKIEADGLETVLANGAEAAQALARELGTTVSGLRQMASDGKITSDVIANAVVKSLEDVRDRAAEMQATMGDAFVRVGNNVTAFVGTVDQATGASAALASAIISAADSALAFGTSSEVMEGAAIAAGALAIVIAARLTPSVVASGTAFATSSIEAIRYQAALARMAGVSAPAAAGIAAVGAAARVASGALALVGGPLGAIMLAASALVYFATRATEAEKESEALDARINKLAGSFDNLTVRQARSAIQDYGKKLADATFAMETAEAKAFTLRRNLEQFPNSKKAEEWASDLVTAEGKIDDAKGAVDEINESLRQLNELVERGGASKLGDDAEKSSDAFSKLNRQLSERLAIAGKASEADRLAARIQGGFIEGLKEGEGEILIALQKQIDAREALTKTVTRGGSASDTAAKQIQGEISALERAAKVWGMTEGEVKIYDLTLKGASESQLEYARSLIATVEGLEAQKKAEEEARAAREQAGKAFETVSRDIGASGTGISEIDQLNIQYEQRREVIAEALATEYLNQQQHDAAMIALDQTTAAARKAIMDEYTAAQQAQQLQSMAAIVSITQTQIAQMQGLFEEGSAIGKAFFVATQALAAANAVVQGFQSAMAIRVAYAQMAAMSGPGAPALLAAGEVHANVAQAMGFATAGMIVGQTVAGFQQGGYTGNMGVSDVAGVVHGREYVFDAAATSRIGVPTLEAIRSGRPLNSSGGIMNGSGSDTSQPITIAPQVVVNGDPDKATIARIEKATADGAKLAYQQISNDLATGRGSVSKSLQSGYGVSRRRG